MEHDASLLERIDHYIEELFVLDDPALTQNRADATAAGLPEINVSANQGSCSTCWPGWPERNESSRSARSAATARRG